MLRLLKTIPVTHKMTEFIASLKLITFYWWCMFFFTCPCWLTCTAVNEGWMILQVHLAKITLVKRPFRNSAGSWGEFQILTKIWDFVWIFNHISRFIAWSLFIPKASYLVKWPILLFLTWSFMWWCRFIDLLKFETCPNFLLNFGTGN